MLVGGAPDSLSTILNKNVVGANEGLFESYLCLENFTFLALVRETAAGVPRFAAPPLLKLARK